MSTERGTTEPAASSELHQPNLGSRSDEHVGDMETLFWRVEKDPHLRNTMTAVFVLDRTPDRAVLADRLERASRQVQGWRHRLVSPPFNLSNPRWVVEPDFDLAFHLRWIGAPGDGTLASVLEYACASSMSGLDRDRPLWMFTVVEGLQDGRAAMIVKLHHVLIDGVGGIGLLPLIVDLGPESQELGPMPPAPEPTPMSGRDLMRDALATNSERFTKFVRSTSGAALRGAPALARDPGSAVTAVRRNVQALGRILVPPAKAPLSPIMTGRKGWWRFAPVEADLEALKRAARAYGCTANDAFIAGVAYGVARYHEHHDTPVDQLRTTVAISIRRADDPVYGNHILGGNFVMPVSATGPIENISAYHTLMKDLRDDVRQPLSKASSTVISSLGPLVSDYVGAAMRSSDVLMSNIPGVDIPIWIGGAEVLNLYGFGPTMGTALNATMVTYNKTAHIGLNADVSAVTDLGLMAECVREGFELIEAARP
jgi:WS/DGAT/MGAT family acyltransferase